MNPGHNKYEVRKDGIYQPQQDRKMNYRDVLKDLGQKKLGVTGTIKSLKAQVEHHEKSIEELDQLGNQVIAMMNPEDKKKLISDRNAYNIIAKAFPDDFAPLEEVEQ